MSKNISNHKEAATTEKKVKTAFNCPEDYSPSSQIARAYSAGCFPNFTHQKLFHALAQALEGKNNGRVDFNQILEKTGMHRGSALQIIRHMANFKILEVSFNSEHIIGEARKSWALVKILKNLEAQELPKSA